MARQGWGRHATVVTGSNDATKQVSVNAWNADLDNDGVLGFTPETIASASTVTPTNSLVKLSGSTSIDTIAITNTNEGDLLWVYTSGSVTLNNTSSPSSDGDIRLLADANKDLSTTTPTVLIRIGTYWYEYLTGEQNAVTASSTTTFTNKTIDADGTGNSITNIENADIKASAGIDATKIANGTVTSTEFQYLGDVTSLIQAQIDGKSPTAGNSSLVTVGTIGSGIWQGTAVADSYVASASTWNAKQNALTFGIADTNAVKIDGSGTATGEYAKFTTTGVVGEEVADVKTDLSLNNVENTALSTWGGTSNIATVGTVGSGTWQGTTVADDYGGTGQSTYTTGDILYASGSNTLAKLNAGSNTNVLTLAGGVPTWAAASGGNADGHWTCVGDHTFNGSEQSYTFQHDFNASSSSEAHIVFRGYCSAGTVSIEWDQQTSAYYAMNRNNGSATATNNASSAMILEATSPTYHNHLDIWISAKEKTAGVAIGTTDTGQNIQISGFGRVNTNNTSGTLREIKLTFTGTPTSTATTNMYLLSNTQS